VAVFIRESLIRRSSGGSWIAYTPLDDFQVHNASLMGAAYLAQHAVDRDDNEALCEAVAIAEFSLRDRQPDGTLNYWSTEQAGEIRQQDTYHSGFEIRALLSIASLAARRDISNAARQYAEVWLREFAPPSGIVAHSRGAFQVTEVHSVAEAMLTLVALHQSNILSSEDFVSRLTSLLAVSATPLWRETPAQAGYYAWKARKGPLGIRVTNIPLIRWSVGWMLLAHTRALTELDSLAKAARRGP
jgi:hypothetical protein